MSKNLKRALKITFISMLSLIFIVLSAIAVAVNFVFTPEKLTPVVNQVANRTLNAQVEIGSVELTFFSSFPDFELKISDGRLVSKVFKDTLWQKSDTLLQFKKCAVSVNPLLYFQNNRVELRKFVFDDATIYAFIDSVGNPNWNIMRADTSAVQQNADTVSSGFNSSININRVKFKDVSLIFDDRSTQMYSRIDSLNLDLKAFLSEDIADLRMKTFCKNILFWQDGELLANRIAFEFDTDLSLNRKTLFCNIERSSVNLNGIFFDVGGSLHRDTIAKIIDVDLSYKLKTPDVATVLNMLPASVIKKSAVTAAGDVELSGSLKGAYGDKQVPVLTMLMKIQQASAHYKGMPYGIDNLTADLSCYLDVMKKKPSYLNIKIFRFQGAETDVLADGRIDDLMGDPLITFNTHAKVNFSALAKTFPLQDGVEMGGKVSADLKFEGRLSAVKEKDLGRLQIKGNVAIENVLFKDSNKDFNFKGNAKLGFIGDSSLAVGAKIYDLILKSRMGSAQVKQMSASVSTPVTEIDTTKVIPLDCKFALEEAKVIIGDTIQAYSQKTEASVGVRPSKKNVKKPVFDLYLRTDSLFMKANETRIGMDLAGFKISTFQGRDSLWHPKGTIGFNRLFFSTPEFGLPIRMQKTEVAFERNTVALRQAKVRIGHSDITATGSVSNLSKAIMKNELLTARLKVVSKRINCNQLIEALSGLENMDENAVETDTISSVSTDKARLFIVPKNVDLEFETNIGRVRYNHMIFENVQGKVQIKDQMINLENLSMKALDAMMRTSLLYKGDSSIDGYAGFNFDIYKINIGKLVTFIPELDTIVPMLRSFKGLVNFNIAAESRLDSLMNIRIPSLRAAVHIKGDSLVLLDGDTFRRLAKILMFKNKKENMFDSISVNITVDNGAVKVYPFVVEIDRYRAAVGGTQNLDMSFNYHVSILKSPLPFKAGVDLYGNLDKVKFRITRAKYKNMVSPVQIRQIDSTRINMGKVITSHFKRLVNN